MEDISKYIEEKMKRMGVYIGVIVGSLAVLTSVIYPFVWKSDVDAQLKSHRSELNDLKHNDKTTRELLIEVSYNLRSIAKKQGVDYIEIGKIQSAENK